MNVTAHDLDDVYRLQRLIRAERDATQRDRSGGLAHEREVTNTEQYNIAALAAVFAAATTALNTVTPESLQTICRCEYLTREN